MGTITNNKKYSNNDNIAAYYHNHRYYRYCSYTIDFDIIHIEIKILDNLHNRFRYSNGKTIPIKLVLISLLKLHLLWQKK